MLVWMISSCLSYSFFGFWGKDFMTQLFFDSQRLGK